MIPAAICSESGPPAGSSIPTLNRVLLVEDGLPWRLILSHHLETAFPGVQIDLAPSVDLAMEALQALGRGDKPYEVVILDYHLPECGGHNPHPNNTVATLVARMDPQPILVRWTCWANDPQLRKLDQDGSLDTLYWRRLLIEKNASTTEPDPGRRVIQELIPALHTQRVLRQFESLRTRPLATNRSRLMISDAWRSLDMARLQADAAAHWDQLAPRLQADLETAFGHISIDGKHYVGVTATAEDQPNPTKTAS